MKNNKILKVLSLVAISSFLLCACGNPNNENSSSSSSEENSSSNISEISSNSSNSSVNINNSESISFTEQDDYDAFCDTWSQANHLYIHYLREDAQTFADYEEYGLWLWEPGKDGALFAAAGNNENIVANTNSWMPNIGGKGPVDQAGVCADIDLNNTNYVSGRAGNAINWTNIDKLGYLVVKLSSMVTGNYGWIKDGIDNYITDIQINKRDNGSIHVFLVSRQTENYRHFFNEEIYKNPINTDTTGNYRSQKDIDNSSAVFPKVVKTSKKFYENAGVGYEIFVPSFRDSNGDGMGDLRGIIDSLDYLQALNVKVLWLSPFLECNSYHGYDTVDYFNVDPRFGTNDDLNELIYKVHEKGMYILMDFVINHSSNQSIWFKKARRGEIGKDRNGNDIKYRDLFHFKFKGDLTEKNIPVEEDPNWVRDGETNYYYYAKFSDDMPEYNYDYSGTRNMVIDVAKYYLGKGIDGFRLDAIKHIYMEDESPKAAGDVILEDKGTKEYYDEEQEKLLTKDFDYSTNQNKNIAFWKEFAYELKSTYPDCYLVGENFDGWDERMSPLYQAMDSQFDFPLYYAAHNWLFSDVQGGKNGNIFAQKMNSKFAFYNKYVKDSDVNPIINSAFTSNHDVSRAINHVNAKKYEEAGTEIDTKITGSITEIGKAKAYAAITMLQPGLSFIYYGDELGMSSNTVENLNEHENNLDRFYRQSFKWQDSSLRPVLNFGAGYTNEYDSYNKKLKDAETQALDSSSMLSFYRGLTAVKQDPTFPINGKFTAYEFNGSNSIYHYVMNANSDTTKDYKIYIHIGGGAPAEIEVPETDEVVFKFDYNESQKVLYSFGVLVLRSK